MDTGVDSAAPQATFDAGDAEELVEYRPPSALAILSLLLGLASSLSFLAPLLLAVPAFGIGVSLIALKRIADSGGTLIGRRAALIGLALCVGCSAAVAGYATVTKQLRSSQADQLARQWFHFLQVGKPDQAFLLTSDGVRASVAPPNTEDEPAAEQENPYDQFLANDVVQAVMATETESQPQLEEHLEYNAGTSGHFIVQLQYRLEAAGQPSHTIIMTLQRASPPGQSRLGWLVVDYRFPDATSGSD